MNGLFTFEQQHIKELPHLTKQSKTLSFKNRKKLYRAEARKEKNIEKKTNHDVKAVEYYLRDQFKKSRQLKGLADSYTLGVLQKILITSVTH
ncbi:MAG: hypothetical protein Ct9H300mP20_08390 [Gammaproteobacteria bacterium]|nr:MAG: hypothetical protein Ct9H300mP20_08390 [Gammaproteobacteria bacterium]